MSGFALRRLASPVTANVVGGFVVVVVAAAIALEILGHEGNVAQNALNLLIYVTLGAAGLVVARASRVTRWAGCCSGTLWPWPCPRKAGTTRS